MRVIFGDFDGVLHPSGGPPGAVLPFEWLPQLAAILEGWNDVRLVVSSTWRESFSLDELRDFLECLGDRFFGVIGPGPKADAIARFLAEHPDVTDAVVLDDERADFPADFSVAVVECNPLFGISCPSTKAKLLAWLRAEHHGTFGV
jgi:hypothetical protein